MVGYPDTVVVYPDTVVVYPDTAVNFCHFLTPAAIWPLLFDSFDVFE